MELVLGNIVEMDTDAIVTPAYSDLRSTPGIRQAVFEAADTQSLAEACRQLGSCGIGQAVVTPSFGLPCKYIIHVVGPGWYSGRETDRTLYTYCYLRALHKATAYQCKTVSVPLMFSGETHVPRNQALKLAFKVLAGYEESHPQLQIKLVLYKPSIYRMAQQLLLEK